MPKATFYSLLMLVSLVVAALGLFGFLVTLESSQVIEVGGGVITLPQVSAAVAIAGFISAILLVHPVVKYSTRGT